MNSMPQAGMTQDVAPTPDTDASEGVSQDKQYDITLYSHNIAEKLDEDKLKEIGTQCLRGFQNDLDTRSDWEDSLDEWTKLACQVRESKSYPWPNASNIKYPLLSTASMQFAARAYPSLIPSDGKIVKSVVNGKDPTGQKLEKATRVSTYMSWQVMNELSGWDEEMDKMLMMLPVVGTIFKKTYYDKAEDKIVSRIVLPKNLVVNYWTKNLRECERISEIIEMSPRLFEERKRQEIFLDVDLGSAPMPESGNQSGHMTNDETTPYEFIEQHTFLNLEQNDDDFSKPYIVTFHRQTGKVVRITARFTQKDIVTNDEGKVIKIKPCQMYTKFGFVPNPDGGFYDIGFGILLGPINESVNTLVNQLVDAGTINNLQSGFIGKALRLKMGDQRFQPGEWKPVNATGDDLRKQIVPLPSKEPSKVLLDLMNVLITSGKELASVAEIFVGKMPGQNTPATTTMASIEQGMKVFTAVYKRIFRSLSEEFDKIFDLNSLYLDPNQYNAVLDISVGPDDFDRDTFDITPGADPTAVSQTEKLLKAQGLMELLQAAPGILDPIKVFSRILEAQEQPNWQELFTQQVQQTGQMPPPPPDPKIMAIQAKMQADHQKVQIDAASQQQQMELDARDKQQQMAMSAQEHQMKMQQMAQESQMKAASEMANARIKMATEQAKAHQQVQAGQQSLAHTEQVHQTKLQQMKETSKLQNSKSKSGKTTR